MRTVQRWYSKFHNNDFELQDKPRTGRPITATSDEKVELVRNLIKKEPHITYEELEEELDIGSQAIHTILHEILRLRKVCARWVPHFLTESEKKARVEFCLDMKEKFRDGKADSLREILTGDETWLHYYLPQRKEKSKVWISQDEPRPTKVRKILSSKKLMVAVFFNARGFYHVVPLQNKKTIDSEWYTKTCLEGVFKVYAANKPRTGLRKLLLHHDNASSHTSLKTLAFLDEKGVKVLPHPPYSPDLAPADYFLFPRMKDLMRGKSFSSNEQIMSHFLKLLEEVKKNDWKLCFQDWFKRMDKCIQHNGEYFEKQ